MLGLEGYRSIIQQMKEADIHLPIVAIGGITLEDIPSIMETGITGIALSGTIPVSYTHLPQPVCNNSAKYSKNIMCSAPL